jgi:Tfp pilus assembly protein PilX
MQQPFHNRLKQRGFIPMIIMIVLVLVGVMYFAFTRVLAAQQ